MLTRFNPTGALISTVALSSMLLVLLPQSVHGDQGDPLAVRIWPHGVVSIETHWHFEVVIDLLKVQALPDELSQADLLITRADGEPWELQFQLQPVPSCDFDRAEKSVEQSTSQWPIKELSLYLDRVANESVQTLLTGSEATYVSKNAVAISHVDDRLLLISVDGVRIALPLVDEFANPQDQLPLDVLVLNLPDVVEADIARAQQLNPRWMVSGTSLANLPSITPETAVGNTLAVCYAEPIEAVNEQPSNPQPRTQWIQLRTAPWPMPKELADLFERKELASRRSQQTFADLSVSQLNFKPSNGTHTPRWNSEHMMGRELMFFSQIYAQRSPSIEVVDLNPQQMPPDYQPKHDAWNGREEARQMERVSGFSRRFAYLLDGLELDKPAPGSSWTLSKLLQQMDKHYTEHSANVVKKFELPEWPKN
jgi:hypothetical protein